MEKKLLSHFILFIVFIFFLSFKSFGQCDVIGNDACTQSAPIIVGNSISCTTPGNQGGRRNFRVTNMVAGATYRVSNCSSGIDTQMTIRDLSNIAVAYNDDNGSDCSVYSGPASIDFIPSTTGTYRIQVNKYDCATSPNTSNGDIVVTLLNNPPLPPSNDECLTATTLNVNTDLNCTSFSSGTVLGATNSGIDNCVGSEDDDVWFKFVATATVHSIDLYNITGSNSNLNHVVYEGTCGALGTPIVCSNPNTSIASNLTAGNTYYIQVYTNTATAGQNTSFDICIGTPPPPPSNDECDNAIGLTVNPTFDCNNVTAGTTVSATASAQTDDVSGTPDNDVWFSFVATSTTHIVSLLNIVAVNGFSTDMGIGIYDASSGCSALTFVDTSDPETLTLNNLTVNNTYLVRVYGWGSGAGAEADFNICISTPVNPCDDIKFISSCGETITGTIASGDGFYNNSICYSTPGNELIYEFTPTVSGNYSIAQDDSYDYIDYMYKIASGGCSGSGWTCIDDLYGNDISATTFPLIANTTYYFMLDSEDTYGDEVSFSILCPPTDNCQDAMLLVSDTSCNSITSSTLGATQSQAGCVGNADDDVWFKFVATTTNHTVTVSPNTIYDVVIQVFSGTCSSLVSLGCENATTYDSEIIELTSLNIGDTYYIRVYSYGGNGDQGTFEICVTEPCFYTLAPDISSCPNVVAGGLGLGDVDPNPITACSTNSCVEIEATYLKLGETTDYNVDYISYNPPSVFGGTSYTTINIPNDDRWSSAYNLPFDFCFYGNTYNKFIVGTNGIITFDLANESIGSGYSFDDNLPSTNYGLFDQSIYGVFQDIDPSKGGQVGYKLDSSGGCDKLIISWKNIPMFHDNSILYTGMMVLYKGTNIIEVYIKEKNVVADWNDGNAIVGVQGDASASEGVAAPCRNGLDQNWSTTNEAWRFTPSGNSVTSLKWYENSIATANEITDPNNDGIIEVCPSATTTYIAEVTYNLCGNPNTIVVTDDTTVTVSGSKIWVGGDTTGPNNNPTDWNNPENWLDNTVPTLSDCIVIPDTANDPIIYNAQDGFGHNLTIEDAATLTLESNATLTIEDFVNVQATGQFFINDSASLIQVENNPTLTNSGNITMNRDSNIRVTDYVYWSSPVNQFNVANVYSTNTPTNYIYEWITTIPTGTNTPGPLFIPICFGDWNPYSGLMENGKGYIVRGPIGHTATPSVYTATFTGVPNNGIITKSISSGTNNSIGNVFYYNPYGTDLLTVTEFDDNWNLIGNPYPSALNAQKFLMDNTNIEGAVHLWTHNNPLGTYQDSFYDDFALNYSISDYVTYNYSGTNTYADESFAGYIGSGQGFFVLSNNGANGNVFFDNSMRDKSLNNSNFYRNSTIENTTNTNTFEHHRIWLNLISPSQQSSSILVGYIEGATIEKDRLYDAFNMESNALNLYSKIENQRMVIQGRPIPFDQNDQVPLGTVIPQAGIYSIAISGVDGLFTDETQNIFLEDTYTNIIHNLRVSPYVFTVDDPITFDDRFILRYTDEALSIDNPFMEANLSIIGIRNLIKVTSSQNLIDIITVYDILGRELVSKKGINALDFTLNTNISDGTYIVRATLYNGQQKIKKVILKQ